MSVTDKDIASGRLAYVGEGDGRRDRGRADSAAEGWGSSSQGRQGLQEVWDPRTNSRERVSVELRDLAAILYARQKYERAREEAGNLDEVVREDYSHMISLIRQGVDPAEVEDAQEAWKKAKRRGWTCP